MNHTCNSLFAEYHYMLIDFQEDTLTWKELDSIQVEQLTMLSQVPSSVQNFALAARALRGDTTYYRHPAAGIEYELRLAEKPDKKKKNTIEPTFELYPNPNDGIFNIVLSGETGVYSYKITDVAGRQLALNSFAKDTGKQTIILSAGIPEGIYLLVLYKPDGTPFGFKSMVIAK